MKTQSLSEIAIEVVITISLIALLGLLAVLIYALLSLLDPTEQPLATAQGQATKATVNHLIATNAVLPEITATLASAKAAPKLQSAITAGDIENLATVASKPLAKMTVKELRPLARERKIPNWRKLKKKELVFYLTA